MSRRNVVIGVAFAWSAIVALTACGSSAPDGSTAAPATATSALASTGVVTLRGKIIEGVAPNCHVLETSSAGRYALTGLGVDALREGLVVEVVGHAEPTLTNRCGRTFVVTHIAQQ